MIYLYDEAICQDLQNSFTSNGGVDPVVRVISEDKIVELAAQIQDDKIHFPIIAIMRADNYSIDADRYNFTRVHKGIVAGIDPEENLIYYEKALPIKLSYTMTIFTTNTADMDELIRELLFKYTQMYFLTIHLPYESNRCVRFGVQAITEEISTESGTADYLKGGSLYRSVIHLVTEGCCLYTYVSKKLTQFSTEIDVK